MLVIGVYRRKGGRVVGGIWGAMFADGQFDEGESGVEITGAVREVCEVVDMFGHLFLLSCLHFPLNDLLARHLCLRLDLGGPVPEVCVELLLGLYGRYTVVLDVGHAREDGLQSVRTHGAKYIERER